VGWVLMIDCKGGDPQRRASSRAECTWLDNIAFHSEDFVCPLPLGTCMICQTIHLDPHTPSFTTLLYSQSQPGILRNVGDAAIIYN